MTDQLTMFRGLLIQTRKRLIKVGEATSVLIILVKQSSVVHVVNVAKVRIDDVVIVIYLSKQ
jgi:hypothetical protein